VTPAKPGENSRRRIVKLPSSGGTRGTTKLRHARHYHDFPFGIERQAERMRVELMRHEAYLRLKSSIDTPDHDASSGTDELIDANSAAA